MATIIDLSLAHLSQLPCDYFPERPGSCRTCLYWENPGAQLGGPAPDESAERRAWFEQVTKEFGPCGKLAFVDDDLAGWARYAPAIYFEGAFDFHHYPVTPYPDIAFLACLAVSPTHRRQGIGSALLEAVMADLKQRRHVGLETIVQRGSASHPSGPFEFYRRHGFYIRRDDPQFPLLRREF